MGKLADWLSDVYTGKWEMGKDFAPFPERSLEKKLVEKGKRNKK